MKIIHIKDFVTNDFVARQIFATFSGYKIIIKGDTGIGGTTAILNITDQTIIIVSPLVGMIQSKELKRQSHQLFIYHDSQDKWSDLRNRMSKDQFTIVNTTPEQLNLVLPNMPELLNIPWFIDEMQIFAEAIYRKDLAKFYHTLFTMHTGGITMSTATPVHEYLDIPPHIRQNMEEYTILRKKPRKKPITIHKIQDSWNFIKKYAGKTKLVIHTNDIDRIKNLLDPEVFPFKVQTLVGATLSTKTSQFRSKTLDEMNDIEKAKIDLEADVYVLSSKFQIGFDIEFPCAVAIFVDEESTVDNKTVNEVVQAYGRSRSEIIEAGIFLKSKGCTHPEIDELAAQIKKIKYSKEYLTIIQEPILAINQALTHPIESLKENLTKYGFDVEISDYTGDMVQSRFKFPTKLKNLYDQDLSINQKQFEMVKTNIHGDDRDYNGFGLTALLLYTTAFVQKITGSKYLLDISPSMNYDRLLQKVKTFFDANDQAYPEVLDELDLLQNNRVSEISINRAIAEGAFIKSNGWINPYTHYMEGHSLLRQAKHIINTLYAIHLTRKGKYDEGTTREIRMALVAMNVILNKYLNGAKKQTGIDIRKLFETDHRAEVEDFKLLHHDDIKFSSVFSNVWRDFERRLVKDGLTLNKDEAEKMKEFIAYITTELPNKDNSLFNQLSFLNTSMKKELKKNKNYLLYMLSKLVANHTLGFRIRYANDREFTPITKVMRPFRSCTPYRMLSIDIKSAYPSFIDKKYKTNVGDTIYERIMEEKTITRREAKVEFNKLLNNHRNSKSYVKKQLMKYGYPEQAADALSKEITKSKGNFYRMMTEIEADTIYDYASDNDIDDWHRLHDSIITYALPRYQHLPTELYGYNFTIQKL